MNKSNELGRPVVPQPSRAPVRAQARGTRLRRKLLPMTIALLFAGPLVVANAAQAGAVGSTTTPTGGVVVGGVGTITQDGAKTLIQQQSAKLALNWQSFDVGQDASVLFKQPSRSAVALNRILDQNPSQIFGRIDSNGQVFLINTHGFIFGATAKMNVGGLLASTLDLTPKDFLANHYNLDAHGASAGIVNHGLIQAASGGSVGLVGGSVSNDGVILAKYGSIHLDGADRAVLDFDGNGLIQIQVTGALQKRLDDGAAAVTNSGTLKADSGTVVLQASAAKDLFTNLVNNSGVVDAGGISTAGGVVRLVASGGNTANSGSINVSGAHGGSAQLLSDQDVMLTDHASVNASGTQGGGSVRIGGGVHGGEGLSQAQRSFIAPDASVRADALQFGAGGSVAVWSTGNTVSMGNISARGGAGGGNGGFVETSGLKNLTVTNAPNVGAANGVGGTWLIDPNDLTIDSGSGATKINATSPFVTTNDGASLGVGLITTALQDGNVTITTGTAGANAQLGNITVNSGFSFDGTGGTTTQTAGTLTLNAAHDITFANNQIFAGTGSYELSVDLEAGNGITFGTGSGITANGGSVTLNAAGAGIALGQIDAASLTANAAGTITQVGALTISGASSFSAGTNAITLGDANNKLTGAVSLDGSDVALTNAMATQLGTVAASGTLGVTTTGALTQSGAVSATGAATFTQNGTTAAEQDITLGNATLGGTVTFAGTINNLTLTNNAATTLDGVTTAGTLDVTSTGTLVQATGSTLSATGAATFTQSGAVGSRDITLGNAALGGDVTFAGTIDNLALTNSTAITNLTIPNIAGDLTLGYTSGALDWPHAGVGTIGGGLSLTAGGGITLNGGITTTGSQTYNSAVTLGSNATLTGTDVNLGGGVTGAGFGLTIAGNATLGAASGLSALSVSGSSALGGNVTTTGTQTYTGAATLSNNVTLATANSAVSFGSTLDSFGSTARDLTVTAGTGGVTFTGIVGGTHALGALDTSATNAAAFAAGVSAASLKTGTGSTSLAGNVSTSGAQDYQGAVALGADLTLASTSDDVHFASTVDNADTTARTLTVDAGGAVAFDGVVGGDTTNGKLAGLTTSSGSFTAGALNIDGGLSVTTTAGGIGQSGAFTVTGTSAFAAGAHAIALTNTGNSFGGAVSLTNSGPHNVALDNGGNALTLGASTLGSGSFSLTGSGALTLAGTLTTDGGAVSLGTPVTLGADSGIDTTNSGGAAGAAIGITGAVDGAHGLTLTAGTGAITLGAAVGGTTPLTALTASGGSFTSGALDIAGDLGITTTAGTIGQTGAFVVSGTSTFNAGAHAITLNDTGNHFTGAVSLRNSGANAVTLNNGTYALTLGTTSIGSGALSLPGTGALTLAGNLTTAGGALNVTGPVAFGSTPVTIDTTGAGTVADGAAINFGGALTGTSDLILNAGTGGVATLGGTVGIASLAVTAGGGIALNAGVTTTGAQTYTGATTLGDDVTLASTGGGAIGLAGSVNGAHALTVNTTGATTFVGVVGGSANLTSLTTDAGGGTTVGGNVTTTGVQLYGDDLTLGANTTLTASSVSLLGVTGGGHNLSTDGATTLVGALTGVGVLSITGATTINTANVATTGAQTYTGAVVLGNDVTLASTGGGDIDLSSTVDGTHALTVNTTGSTIFGGAVGGTANLASLTTNAGGGTTLNGDVTTSGAQTYGDTLTLGGDTTLNGASVSLAAVTGGTHDLATIGATTLGGALSGVGTLSVTGATTINTAGISTTGDQTYGGAVTLGANTVLTSAGTSGITFTGTIDNANATARSLEIDATTGDATFGGGVGTGAFGPLAGLTVTTAGDISQATGGLFEISGASSFTAGAGAGNITLDQANAFGNAVSLTSKNVSINNVGSLQLGTSTVGGTLGVTAGGSITQATGGAPLKVTGASTFTVTAAGADVLLKDPNNDLQGAVIVATSGAGTVHDLWLTNTSTTAGNFTPPASITNNLTLDYANAALALAATSLGGALDVTSGTGITLSGNVTTGGNQAYHGAVTLGTGLTLDSSSGDGNVTFDGTLGNATPEFLTVNAGAGAVSFGGAVGSSANPLGALGITSTGITSFGSTVNAASLSTGSGSTSLGGNVTTAGTQTYGGAVGLAGDAVLTTTNSAVTFAGTVDNADSAAPAALTVNAGSGGLSFGGAVGLANGGLAGLTTTSGTFSAGALTVDGDLDVTTSAGGIGQTDVFTVTGAAAFDAGAHAIALGNTGNAFSGVVSLHNTGANDVAIANDGALELGDSAVGSGTLSITAAGISQATGTALTQASAAGVTTLDAGAGALVLANTGNDFTGAVTASGNGVQLVAAHNLNVVALTSPTNYAVNLTAGGTLSMPTGAIDTGTEDLTLSSGGTLAMPGTLTGRNISLTSGGDLAVNNALTGTGTITLTSTTGNITQNSAGVILSTGGALAGTSGGSTTLLNASNQVANLGEFKTGGDFSFNNAQALTVNHPVLANGGLGNITLTTTGAGSDLVLDTQIQGTDVTLGAGGEISQTSNGTIQASTLTGTSTGDTTLTGPNDVGTLLAFTSGGDFSFTNAADLTVVGPLAASTGNITLSTNWTGTGGPLGGDLTLNTGITATNVELDALGAITQQAGTVITATTLTGAASGDVAMDGDNLVTTLGNFSAANFSLVNNQDLAVTGALTTTGGTGNISLKTKIGTLDVGSDLAAAGVALDSAGDLTLAKNVTGTTAVTLNSGGVIDQTNGIITTATLGGSSVGATSLGLANQVTALGDFSANGFSLTNDQALAINGALDGGSTGVTLTVTAGDLTEGTGGAITAGTFTGSSAGDTTLGGANLIDTLDNFSAANFSLTNAKDLAVNGTLATTGGTGDISLETTAGTLGVNSNLSGGAISLISATDLALGQTIDGSTSVNLGAGGAITQNAGGVIQTALLTGTSGGSTTLDQGNIVAVLGNFTTGANFTFNSAQSLTVSNPVSANNGNGNITLTTTGAGSDLELNTGIKGTIVTLGAAGEITQTAAGNIQATTLTGSSGGDTTLTGPNQVGTLGQFSTGGNFSFANAKTLTVTGPLSAPGGTINLSAAAGGSGDLLLNTSIHAANVTLAAKGAITQQAGTAIQASTLTGSASGQVALGGANLIDTLGSFSAAGFSLSNAQALTVNGPLTTSGDVSLTTTSGVLNVDTDLSGAAISLTSAGDLTLAHAVSGTSINLESGGAISQAPTGSLTAATLTGKSVGSTVLGGGGGGIGALGDFTANGFSLTNGQALTVTGVVDGGPGVVLKTTAGDLTINGTVKGTATTLTSAGAIGEGDAGVLSAATLTGSSAGATTLASTHNAVGTLNGFSAKGFSLTSNQALTVNGVLDGGDSVALTTTAGDLTLAGEVDGATTTLTAAGALREGPNGTLAATTLSGSSGGDTTLDGVNQIATLGQFAAQNLDLTNTQALDVAGPVTIADGGNLHLTTTTGGLTINGALSGGAVVLTAAGDIAFNQTVKGTTVALVSGGKISQTDSGILTAGTLTGSSVGATDLDPVNHVDTLGSFSANGFSLANDHALTVIGPVTGGPLLFLKTTNGDLAINGAVSGKAMTLISAGAITEGSGGSLVADTLTGSSVGATTLDAAANLIGTLKAFSASSFSLTTGQALTIAEALNGGSALTLTTTKGDLLLNAGLTSTGLTTLNSAGAITAGVGGSITAGTLTGNAVGPTLLGSAATPVDNYIGTLGGFVSPAGFSLTNNQTLTLASVGGSTYTVDAGTSTSYLAVLTGDLLQSGSNWLRNGTGTWSSSGAMGTAHAPIYVLGVGAQQLDAVGLPPGYFYALDAQGNLLPLTGAASFNVPTSALTSHAQNSNNHTDAYIDPSIITARYRAFGMVPPGLMLPADQQRCDPNVEDCPGE